jgi:hypothetical protein
LKCSADARGGDAARGKRNPHRNAQLVLAVLLVVVVRLSIGLRKQITQSLQSLHVAAGGLAQKIGRIDSIGPQ